jgi:hypothetical protein
MNWFWKCGVSKKDVVENPIVDSSEEIEYNSTDSLSDKTLAPIRDTRIVPECDAPECDAPECDAPISQCDSPECSTPECSTPECSTPECSTFEPVMEKKYRWFGTISTAYNNEREYYIFENEDVIYFGRFPLEWALNHEPGSGPNECEQCFQNGMYNDVFIGYCVQCATEKYKGLCGRGFISSGAERHDDDENNPSAFDNYLKDVDLDLVGKDYIWYGFNVEMEYCGGYDENELDELLNN